MKNIRAWFSILFASVVFGMSFASHAGNTLNPNPNVTMTMVGAGSFNVTSQSVSVTGFSVRVTDPQGQPIPGITVEFFVNGYLCAPLLPCTQPPSGFYGKFATGSDFVQITTNANGVASTPAFITGIYPGSYQVASGIYGLDSTANSNLLKGQGNPTAYFDIGQSFALTDGYMSGNWYDPAQPGHGIQLEFTDQNNMMLAIWFVYGPDGGQNWIMAQGQYDPSKTSVTLPATIQTGGKFPPLFKATDTQSTPWGQINIRFTDCNNGTLNWNSSLPGYGVGQMRLVRLTSIRGTKCP